MVKKEEVIKIADLARLQLSESEVGETQKHFQKLMDHFECLQNVDTQGVEPLMTPHDLLVELRQDWVIKTLSVDELLNNAPDTKDSLFKVPPVV